MTLRLRKSLVNASTKVENEVNFFFVVQVENSSTFAPALKRTLKNVVKEI